VEEESKIFEEGVGMLSSQGLQRILSNIAQNQSNLTSYF